jgi:predicted nucleotidyltransferase
MNTIKKYLTVTSHQKVLSFLLNHPSRSYMEKEIVMATKVSKSAVNEALKELAKDKLVLQEKKGRMSFYSVDLNDPIIRRLKSTENVSLLKPLIEQLKKNSQKIILFGSFADGTNVEDSDIDLFILSDQPDSVQKVIQKSPLAEKIQPAIKKPSEFIGLDKKKPLFYQEIERGVILWEIK